MKTNLLDRVGACYIRVSTRYIRLLPFILSYYLIYYFVLVRIRNRIIKTRPSLASACLALLALFTSPSQNYDVRGPKNTSPRGVGVNPVTGVHRTIALGYLVRIALYITVKTLVAYRSTLSEAIYIWSLYIYKHGALIVSLSSSSYLLYL